MEFQGVFLWLIVLYPFGVALIVFIFYYLSSSDEKRDFDPVVFYLDFLVMYPAFLLAWYILDICQSVYESEGIHSFEGLLYYIFEIWGPLVSAVSISLVFLFIGTKRKKRSFAYVSRHDNFLATDKIVVKTYRLRHKVPVDIDVKEITTVIRTLDMIVSGQKNYGFVRFYLNVFRINGVRERDIAGKLRYYWERKIVDRHLRFIDAVNLSIASFGVGIGIFFIFFIGLFYEIFDLMLNGDIDRALFYLGLVIRPKYPTIWLLLLVMPLLLPIVWFLGGIYVFSLSKNGEVRGIIEKLIVKIIDIVSGKTPMPIRLSLSRPYDGVRILEKIRYGGKDMFIVEIPVRGDSS